MAFSRFNDATDFNGKGVRSLPDQPTISAEALKRKFDEDARDVVAPKVNVIVGELEDPAASASLGAVAPTGFTGNTVQAVVNSIAASASDSAAKAHTHSNKAVLDDLSDSSGDLYYKGNPISGGGGGTWGSITGDLADQTDLANALSAKADSSSLADVATSGLYSDLGGTPSLATVATSGSYSDLSNKPTIPAVDQTYNPASTNAQSGTAVAGAIATKSNVGWSQAITTGQKIATVTIDGTPTDVYAPTGGGGGGGGAVDSVNGQTGTVVLDVDDINDVTIASIADQDTLVYNGTTHTWGNEPLADVALSGSYNDLSNAPSLATVATTGSYSDLSGTPTIPAAQIQSDWTQADNTKKDFIKNKPTIPAAQIQSDWNQADTTAKDYIKNKPTIQTVNDATLTIQKNGATVNAFTANASSNVTANIVTGEYIKTASVSSGSVTFTGVDDSVNSGGCGYDVFFDVTSSSTNKSPYAKLTSISGEGTNNCTLTYQTDADDGTNTAHLYQYK